MSLPKEKRTKEQAMRLLDRAIEQEETLLEKINILEIELADCRKKVENPRHELEEQALPGSKVSFRLDYYRTEKNGPFKGIIEHLPSRERQSFEDDGFAEISNFITQFVGISSWSTVMSRPSEVQKNPPASLPEIVESTVEVDKKERSPLLKKLFPEIFGTPVNLAAKHATAAPKPVPLRIEAAPFLVLTEGAESNQRALRQGQSFQIEIPMQDLEEFQGKPCSVTIMAESPEQNLGQTVKRMEYCTPGSDPLRIPIRALPLEPGLYRLVVSMTLRDEPEKAYYQEDRIVIVQ